MTFIRRNRLTQHLALLCAALIVSVWTLSAPAFAESAPVYDADTIPQDQEIDVVDNDQEQYYQPSSPGQEGSSFITVQPTIAPAGSVSASAGLSVEQRIQRVEQQVNNMQNSDAATRVDSLQDQVQVLRNQIEVLTHQLEQLQHQQKNSGLDLDKHAGQTGNAIANQTNNDNIDTTNEVGKPIVIKSNKKIGKNGKQTVYASSDMTNLGEGKSSANQPNLAEEQQIYQTAYNFIKAKKYNDAIQTLQGMLKRYPSGQFASNAHYWLGELYGLMGKNEEALNEFNEVVRSYPDSPRVSDAQLKVGLILASESKWVDAKSVLRNVINHYPGSASARLAAEQLKQIRQAGH